MPHESRNFWRVRARLVCAMSLCLDLVPREIASQSMRSSLPSVTVDASGEQITNHIKAPVRVVSGKAEIGKAESRNPMFEGNANVWVRGSSSAAHPKKPYRLELVDENGGSLKAPLLGMPNESDWILFPAYTDKSLVRDVLGYE